MWQDLEITLILFRSGQIIVQESLHRLTANAYTLPPGRYTAEFKTTGYDDLYFNFDVVANQSWMEHIGFEDCTPDQYYYSESNVN